VINPALAKMAAMNLNAPAPIAGSTSFTRRSEFRNDRPLAVRDNHAVVRTADIRDLLSSVSKRS
jgi:hypothetical protein